MQVQEPSSKAIISLSEASIEKFNSLEQIAQRQEVSITGIYFYVAIGSLNFHPSLISDTDRTELYEFIFTGIKPKKAASFLACDSKKIARWCVTLTKRKLLIRDPGGAYKVTDINVWYSISQLITTGSAKYHLFPGNEGKTA